MAADDIPDNVVSLDLFRKINHPRSNKERKQGNIEKLISFLEDEIKKKDSLLSDVKKKAEELLEDAKRVKINIDNQD